MTISEAAYIAGIIDGEGSISLTRNHKGENRRPCITISSNDIELLNYIKEVAGGVIIMKKNYKPDTHNQSYTLNIKRKNEVFNLLGQTIDYLRINKKRKRAEWIIKHYDDVTPRNGKYTPEMCRRKEEFESTFFNL